MTLRSPAYQPGQRLPIPLIFVEATLLVVCFILLKSWLDMVQTPLNLGVTCVDEESF